MSTRRRKFIAAFIIVTCAIWIGLSAFGKKPLRLRQIPHQISSRLPAISLSPSEAKYLSNIHAEVADGCWQLGSPGLFHWLSLNYPRTTLRAYDREPVDILAVLRGVARHPQTKKITVPFFRDTVGSIRPMKSPSDRLGEAHFDQTLSTFASCGVSLSDEVLVAPDSERVTVADVVRQLLDRYEPGLEQPGFSAIAIMGYVEPGSSWRNRNGDLIDLEIVLSDLVKREFGSDVCGGTHILEGIARLMMLDRESPFLSQDGRAAATQRLRKASTALMRGQNSLGGWSRSWFHDDAAPMEPITGEDMKHCLHFTSHHLEWIAICDSDLRPDEDSVEQALRCCVRLLHLIPVDELRKSVCPPVHALRCIEVSAGRLPAESQLLESTP